MDNTQLDLIKSKIMLDLPLSEKEEAMYLLFVATIKEANEILKKKKKEVKDNERY